MSPEGWLLLESSGTGGPGGKLVIFNSQQRAGSHTAAGVTGLTLDMANLGSTDLALRLAGPAGQSAISTAPVLPAAGSGWQNVSFPLAPQALTVDGGSDVGSVLAGVTELRLFHSSGPAFPGPDIAASLTLDNITAVPESPNAWPLGAGLAAIGLLGRRHRRLA